MEKITRILIISSDKNLRDVLGFCFDGWGYEVFLHGLQIHDIGFIKKISPDVIVVDVHSARQPELEICKLLKDDFITAFIPIITIIDKRQLREELLEIRQGVDDYLIKPPDPLDLRIRIEMAIKRSQYSFYASPLTGLPGGRIIEEVLKEKIKGDVVFSFGHADIDNFKYFNDVYGYIKGDRAIMQTAYILYTVSKAFGNKNDFIGHIGGDDFVFISTPDKYEGLCRNFIQMFDKITPFHYSTQDREQGFLIAKDRTQKIKKIPLMSISIAVVNKTSPSEFRNVIEVNEKLAEIKRYLKSMPGSKFMAERRNHLFGKPQGPQPNEQGEKAASIYKPLGQILIEKNMITPEQLDEALNIHWKRGVVLGEILKELNFIKEEDLNKALNAQESLPSTSTLESKT
jgi:diguanylate cyclase (GGDEF)-like protein